MINDLRLSIILPTYNEASTINKFINEIISIVEKVKYDYEIILVDDNSPDKTYETVCNEFAHNPRVLALLRTNEKGLATAILYGIHHASKDRILVMDTDFNHPPQLIPIMVSITDYYDICVGSRYVIGGGMNAPRWRNTGSKLYNLFIRTIIGSQTHDNLSGFFVFKKPLLLQLKSENIFYGYGDYFIRFLYAVQKLKKSMVEIPVYYQAREGGVSKTNFYKEIIRYTKTVFKIKLRTEKYIL
jgi:dolichol-phosphate mannosyltransferase